MPKKRDHIKKMLEMLKSEPLSRVELQQAHQIIYHRVKNNLCSPEHVLGVEDAGEKRKAAKDDGGRPGKEKGGKKDKDGDVDKPAKEVREKADKPKKKE